MALLKSDIDFMSARKRKLTSTISGVMLVIALLALIFNRFEFGLDFTSGTLIEVGYSETVNPEDVRQQLIDAGYEQAVVVAFGSDRDLLVRLPVEEGAGAAGSDGHCDAVRCRALSVQICGRFGHGSGS